MGRSALWRDGWPFSKWPNVPYQLNRNSPQARGLVGWWPTTGIGLGTDPALKDRSGHGYDMTTHNTPTVVTDGRMGRAVLLSGTDQHLQLPDAALNLTTALTLSCWAYVIGNNQQSDNQRLFSRWDDPNKQYLMLLNRSNATDYRLYGYVHNGATVGTGGGAVNLYQAWHLLVVTYDNVNVRAYTDGLADGTAGAAAGPLTSESIITRIGCYFDVGYFQEAHAYLADARIYNRALTDQEVLDLYRNPWELYEPVIRWWAGYTGGGTPVVPDWPGGYRRVAVGVGAGVLTVDR